MKFGLRDIFWLTLACALSIALVLSTIRMRTLQEEVRILEERHRSHVEEMQAVARHIAKPFQFDRDSHGDLFVTVID